MPPDYGIIYIWRDKKHKKYYIGCHWGHKDDGYVCSSKWMKKAYNKRPDDFKRRIIKRVYTSRKDMFLEEQKYLDMIKKEELGKKYYNFTLSNSWNLPILSGHTSETKRKISEKQKGRKQSNETKEKLRQYRLGKKSKPHSDETRRKISESNKGKIRSEEHSKKISAAKTGKKLSEDHKKKMSDSIKGRKLSKEHRLKISENNRGRVVSLETRKKISETLKKKKDESLRNRS